LSHHLPFFNANFTENQYLMAKTISDEQMKFTMIINGNSAQKELFDLEKSTRSLNEQNKALLLQKKLLEKQGQKDTDQYKLLTATIKANSTEVTNNKNRMAELQKEIGLTGLTMGQLQSKATMLRNTLRNLVPGSEDYKRYEAELKAVSARMGEVSGRASVAKSSLGSLADSFNRYQGMALSVIATLTGMVLSIQKIIDYNGKLSDAQADVMKTTRMTKEEVDDLTKSFGLLKTRTQRIDLLGIAKVAGELNIAKSEVGDFVKVMDKAGVSLGDSFEGGAEEVATKLGKIKTLYEELKDAKVELAFESVGSALNDLGADGNATAANISDFVTRVGTLSEGLKPTISEALGLGAAFEETGLNAEIAGNNYGKLLRIAARDTPKFAQFMKMTNDEATKLINTDPTEFFLKFTQAFGNIKDATKQASLLDSLKLNDNEVGMIINSAAKNTDLFRQKIDLATASLDKGTSMTEEFNIKNSNLAATLEKIKKTTTGWFSSDTFVQWLTSAVTALANLIGASDDADGSAKRLRDRFIFMIKIIAIVVTSYISYNAAVKLTAMWTNGLAAATQILNAIQNRGAIVTGILRSAQLLLAASYYTITGNTVRATAAMRLFNASASANPLGLVLVAISAVVAGLILFSKESSKASKVQQMHVDIQNEVAKSISKEKNEVLALVKVIQDETVSKDKKLAAIKRLNEISPEYLKGLTLENIKTLEGKKILDSYIDALYKKARATAVASKIQKLEDDKLDIESKTVGDFRKEQTFGFLSSSQYDKIGSRKEFEPYVQKQFSGTSKQWHKEYVDKMASLSGLKDKEKAIAEIDAQMNALKPEYEKNLVDGLVTKVDPVTPNDTPGGLGAGTGTGTKRNPNSTLAEINRRKIDEAQKTNEELLALDQQLQDDKLSMMEDGAAKELILEQERYLREIAVLEQKKVHTDELAKLEEDLSKAKESGDTAEYNRLFALKQGWNAKNKVYDDKIDAIKLGKLDIHNKKVATLKEKAETERIQKEQEQFDLEKMQRETAFNNEINALNLSDAERKKRQDAFDKKELKIAKAHIADKIVLLKAALADELFSPEVQAKMEKQLAFLENAASKIADVSEPGKKSKTETIGDAAKSAFGETDVLGYTPTQWTDAFDNLGKLEGKLEAVGMVVQGMQNLWGAFANYQNASEAAQLQKFEKNSDAKKTKLKKQLDSGVISQKNYDKQVSKIDAELEAKKADLDYSRAKREKQMALVGAIISTAKGVATALPNLILAGLAAVVGGIQVATIAKQPLPAKGHEAGLYPEYVKRSQDGKVFQSKYQGKTRSGLVSKTSHFLVAENGPEMVIDNKAWREMDPAVKDSLMRDLRGIKGWENGLYNESLKRIEVPAAASSPTSSSNDTQMLTIMMSLVAENTAVLKDLRDKGVLGIMTNKDLKSMGYIKEGIDNYNDLRTKSKK
jgi:TP901 family phage tail tape measure protein